MTFDAGGFATVACGRLYEDFTIGQVFEHHWGRTITEADNVLFCSATCNWHPLYLNAEFARAHGYPDVLANPLLVLCTTLGLSVEDLSEIGGPLLGITRCRFAEPVHPGDTITARSVVAGMRLTESRPDSGAVTWSTTATNQRGQVVVDYERTNLVARRAS